MGPLRFYLLAEIPATERWDSNRGVMCIRPTGAVVTTFWYGGNVETLIY